MRGHRIGPVRAALQKCGVGGAPAQDRGTAGRYVQHDSRGDVLPSDRGLEHTVGVVDHLLGHVGQALVRSAELGLCPKVLLGERNGIAGGAGSGTA